jgi:hypothetical protein
MSRECRHGMPPRIEKLAYVYYEPGPTLGSQTVDA